ncbi:MAG: hypothetical protein AB1656_11285 [Candidatus Omnitrophota bacterium]
MRYGWAPPINRLAGSNMEASSAVPGDYMAFFYVHLSLDEREEGFCR